MKRVFLIEVFVPFFVSVLLAVLIGFFRFYSGFAPLIMLGMGLSRLILFLVIFSFILKNLSKVFKNAWNKLYTQAIASLVLAGLLIAVLLNPFIPDIQQSAECFALISRVGADQQKISAAAEKLMNNASDTAVNLGGSEIPVDLKVISPKIVCVSKDHVSIVLYHDPDHDAGIRIWRDNVPVPEKDCPIGLPGLFLFSYRNDLPITPGNML